MAAKTDVSGGESSSSFSQTKPRISLVVLGHVNAGKSTTVGRLLHSTGAVSDANVARCESLAAEAGMDSFKYAWIVDDLRAERERGITIDVSLWKFETSGIAYTIIDAPGHRDYVKNAITGASQADSALLVVDASEGGFREGMARDGQTREHALLAYALGVKQVIVVINKMDDPAAEYGRARYDAVRSEVASFLKKVGYKPARVAFVPISGWTGENMVRQSKKMGWYDGPTLLEALDAVPPPKRSADGPLRMPIQDVYKIGGVGTVPVGRVESGILRRGIVARFAPSGKTAGVGSLERHHETVEEARPGDNVGFRAEGLSSRDVRRGDVVSDDADDRPARKAASFVAQIIVMNHPGDIVEGYAPVVDVHTSHGACQFESILERLDRRTGKCVEQRPASIKNGDAALVKMVPLRPMCVEAFGDFPALGRFAVRDMKRTVAVGVVKSVVFAEEEAEREGGVAEKEEGGEDDCGSGEDKA